MLSFDCPKCGEKELIEPFHKVIQSIEQLVIRCITCGYEGKPSFYIAKCKGINGEGR